MVKLKVALGGITTVVILGVGSVMLFDYSKEKAIEREVSIRETEEFLDTSEKNITRENYEKITRGDVLTGEGGTTKEDVISLLGEPMASSEDKNIMSWSSSRNGINITVEIIKGRVSNKTISEI